jgi:hypothetical protein
MTLLRAAAFGIAIIAVVDPAVTSTRSSRPLVAVIHDSVTGAALSARVAGELARRFTVVRGALDAAAATVMVGDAIPDESHALRRPVMAVLPRSRQPAVRIVKVDVPAVSAVDSRVPVAVTVRVSGARGRRLDLRLGSGAFTTDRASWNVSGDTTLAFTLHHVPLSAGSHAVHIGALIDGAALDSASTAFDARADPLPVLFFDPRPSWMATFVRRALERDPRFSVTHRVATSRGISNTSGAPPASLRDPQVLSDFATIVVSAPEQLSDGDVNGLETFMRRRGGRVVILMERRAAGAADRLTGVSAWRTSQSANPLALSDPTGVSSLNARELAWPATLPFGAMTHAISAALDSTRRPIVWSVPVGAGRLLVSGALDAWHHRDASGFHGFWAATIAELSVGAPAAVETILSRHSLAPGEAAVVRTTVRDAFLSDLPQRTARVGAVLVSGTDTTIPRLWPTATPGVFEGRIVAPRERGTYRLIVSAGRDSSKTSVVVDPAARKSLPDDRSVIEAFVASRGGSVIAEEELGELPARLSSALQVVSRVETWHPMRSGWWIVPFALLLGAEWWSRRRRGLV